VGGDGDFQNKRGSQNGILELFTSRRTSRDYSTTKKGKGKKDATLERKSDCAERHWTKNCGKGRERAATQWSQWTVWITAVEKKGTWRTEKDAECI